jgi:hypothetical protein
MSLSIGDYELVDLIGIQNQHRLYKFKCKVCGHERIMQMAEFKRAKNIHAYQSCKEDFYKSIQGRKFGDYVVVSSTKGVHRVRCSICGFEKVVSSFVLYHTIGLTHQSCGNFTKDKYYKKLHSIWTSLRTRTNNKNCKAYKDYGGRGIQSDDFKYFCDFYNHALPLLLASEKEYDTFNLSIDRIDNNQGYSIGNIRFTTMKVQNRNRRTNKRCVAISPFGEEHRFDVARDFASIHKLCASCISLCLKGVQSKHKGWTFFYEDDYINKFGLCK